jgi:hypothetical protein
MPFRVTEAAKAGRALTSVHQNSVFCSEKNILTSTLQKHLLPRREKRLARSRKRGSAPAARAYELTQATRPPVRPTR